MTALIWLLVGAGVGAGYQALHPLGQRMVTSIARGAVGGVAGGILYAVFVDRESPASWLGSFFVATMAVCVAAASRALWKRFDAYRKSQDLPPQRP